MEGKESLLAFWPAACSVVEVTTAASCGAVNAMHDLYCAGRHGSWWLMQIGEVVFGGVGSGLYGMLLFVMLAVFIAGLMIGRTPEYYSVRRSMCAK